MPYVDSGCERCQISFHDDAHDSELVNDLHLLKTLSPMQHLDGLFFLEENGLFFDHSYNQHQPAAGMVAGEGGPHIAPDVDANEALAPSLDGAAAGKGMQDVCLNKVVQKTPCDFSAAASAGKFRTANERNSCDPDHDAHPDYIPNNYEEEMEACSDYIFSNAPYCLRTSRSLCGKAAAPSFGEDESDEGEDGEDGGGGGGGATAAEGGGLPAPAEGPRPGLERRSSEYQKHANRRYHWVRNWLWAQHMQTQVSLTDAQSQHALRALLREACRRDLLRLHAAPVEQFRGAAPARPAEGKAFAIRQLRETWRALAESLDRELAKGTSTRALQALLSARCLFCGDRPPIPREIAPCGAADPHRQRRRRAARLLRELARTGRRFIPPPSPSPRGRESPEDDENEEEEGDENEEEEEEGEALPASIPGSRRV